MDVDVEKMKYFLNSEGFLQNGHIITSDVLYTLVEYSAKDVARLFPSYNPSNTIRITFSLSCMTCNNDLTRYEKNRFQHLNKLLSSLKEIIRIREANSISLDLSEMPSFNDSFSPVTQENYCERMKQFHCSSCVEVIDDYLNRLNTIMSSLSENEKAEKYYTIMDLIEFSSPLKSYSKYKFEKYSKYFLLYKDKFVAAIKSKSYKEYLSSPLWKLIAQHVKAQSGFKCKLCATAKNLQCHHSNYKRYGLEMLYWRYDLICICQSCHEKFHHHKKSTHKPQGEINVR